MKITRPEYKRALKAAARITTDLRDLQDATPEEREDILADIAEIRRRAPLHLINLALVVQAHHLVWESDYGVMRITRA